MTVEEGLQQAIHAAAEGVKKELQDFREEQQKATEQLLCSLQSLAEQMQAKPKLRKPKSASIMSVEPPPLEDRVPKERNKASSVINLAPAAPAPSQSKRSFSRGDSHISGSQTIPSWLDLERRMMLDSSSSHQLQPLATPEKSKRRPSDASVPDCDKVDELQVLPNQPEPKVSAVTTMTLHRRGSKLDALARSAHIQILADSHDEKAGAASEIFDTIGVSLWLNYSRITRFWIILLQLCHMVLALYLYTSGLQQSGEQWTALASLLFSLVAILLLHLVKHSLKSEDLNLAVRKLDSFVANCGHGLGWDNVAKTYWRQFLFLWGLVVLAFGVEQGLEVWVANDQALDLQLRCAKVIVSFILFGISSAVIMSGVYVHFNLLLGLAKTLDCWCADLVESHDFMFGVRSWNSLQALLKCVGREVTRSFTALIFFGYAGFFASMAGVFSMLLDEDLDGWRLVLYVSALLPLQYLFYLSAGLFAKGASLSEKCRQIPAFVNQLRCVSDADTERQYLVRYIADSSAGFVVHGIMLSQSAFLRQMHFLTAVLSGLTGILLRRYL